MIPVLYRVLYGDSTMFRKVSTVLRKKQHKHLNFYFVLDEVNVAAHRKNATAKNTWSDVDPYKVTTRLEVWGDPVGRNRSMKRFMVFSHGGPIGPAMTLRQALALMRPGDELWERTEPPVSP